MKCPKCGTTIKNPVSVKGGKKSKRKITPEQQAKMQAGRKAAALREKDNSKG